MWESSKNTSLLIAEVAATYNNFCLLNRQCKLKISTYILINNWLYCYLFLGFC